MKQPINPPQKRRQRLARAGRREDQRVVAALDGGPALLLRRRWLTERLREPGAGGRQKSVRADQRWSDMGMAPYEHLCVWSSIAYQGGQKLSGAKQKSRRHQTGFTSLSVISVTRMKNSSGSNDCNASGLV